MSDNEPKPSTGTAMVPHRDRRGVYTLETIDLTRLHAILSDADRLKGIGDSIIRALIEDVLKSKLGFDDDVLRGPHWVRVDTWQRIVVMGGPPIWNREALAETAKAVQDILTDVSLSQEEQKIVQQLALRLRK